ncbi:MAG: hypothetical protein V7K71_28460 [Nostoc sp.]|uniref:hypothetical protein n=1 Tax=Nostoc sp. TaxID=1180 RepID=UPI002FFD0471
MGAILYPLYTVANLVLATWSISLWQHSHHANILLLLLVVAGMTYDNLIISLGRLINEGSFLKSLNRLRFLLHDLLIPLLVVVAIKLASAAGVFWANKPILFSGCWTITFGLIGLGLMTNLKHLELAPINVAGSLRYKPKNSKPPISTIFIALLVGVAGFYIWREIQWPWMFVGTVVMLFGNALPTKIFGSLVGSAVDFVFILALLTTHIVLS